MITNYYLLTLPKGLQPISKPLPLFPINNFELINILQPLTTKKINSHLFNMRKNILSTIYLTVFTAIAAFAQPTLVQGNEMPFTFKKQPPFTALHTNDGAYFVFKSRDFMYPYPTVVAVNNGGNVTRVTEVKYQQGVMGNVTEMLDVVSINGKLIGIIQNRNKSTNTNKLTAKTIDNGVLSTDEKEIGSFPFEKMGKAGDWYTTVTPDGKHLAIVAELPADKEELVVFKYYFLDADLKQTATGEFSFPEMKKRLSFNSFYASDKGDFYLVMNEFDKTYRYPKLYKAKSGEKQGTIIPVMPENPKQKLMSFTGTVNANGDLVFAGYIKDKSVITIGDDQATGSFIYTTATSKMNINLFDKPISNANAEGIVFNGNTIFLVGEQLKADRETPTQQQAMAFEENYNYRHNDIIVTAFDASDASKKFELTLSKKFAARNFDQDLYPAFGIVNNKLAVVYNDTYGKYVPNTSYDNYKVPVLVYINNDGLMEAPIHFDKEFQTTRSSYTLYPAFNTTNAAGIILLAGNGSSVKGVVVK